MCNCACAAARTCQVRESTGPNSKQSPFIEELLKAQEAAQSSNKGLWTKVRGTCDTTCGVQLILWAILLHHWCWGGLC